MTVVDEISSLLAGAMVLDAVNNQKIDYLSGSAGSNAYRFSAGQSGDDVITQFSARDTLLSDHLLYDANHDGIIGLGANHVLDMDRTSKTDAGRDQVTLRGMSSNALRYLGSKDGSFVYADAATRQAGWIEGTVGDDRLDARYDPSTDASPGKGKTFFYDTALGINLGTDHIDGFSQGDSIVLTTPITSDSYHSETLQDAYEIGAEWIVGGAVDLPGLNGSPLDSEHASSGRVIFGMSGLALKLTDIDVVGSTTYWHYACEEMFG